MSKHAPQVIRPGGSLSGGEFSGLCPGLGGVSVQDWGISVQGVGGLCPGVSVQRVVSVRETPLLYGNERAVRILLECILVWIF